MTEHPDPHDFGEVVPFTPRSTLLDLPKASFDTEAALIGGVLMQPHILPLVQHLVAPEHFAQETHATIWRTMLALAEAGETPNLLRVKGAIGPKLLQFDLGGMNVLQYLARIAKEACTVGSAEEYARVVQQFWQLRELAIATADVREAASFVPSVALQAIYARIDEIRASFVTRKATSYTFAEAGDALLDRITAELQGTAPALATTGIEVFDREIGGGPQPSTMLTVAGRTSMGKSIFGIEAAGAIADQGRASIYHSLEMSHEQVAARLASSELERRGIHLPYGQIMRRGGLTPKQAEIVAGVVHEQRGIPFRVEDGGKRTIGEIAASSDRLANHYARKGVPLGCIVIDHAHIVKPSRAFRREDEGLKEVADGALALAKHLDCPVFLLAQCNRGTEGREDKRPQLSDIRGAGAFEENSDAVIFLYRPAYYIERSQAFRDADPAAQDEHERVKHLLEIIIDKNRAGGANQVVRAWIDPALNAIRNWQRS
ncbi:replicative DNA helicase [Methylorubrum rhodesianum]|uniref:replicative DNA helicase n=1 Tax=Methylorubrum TaxID=2282523 RepID=UPI00129CA87B|nr:MULTISPECIES: replicative DNA helicase [Methylorubrum]MBB5765668.1 replicative DNA helicase [Methylorubrum rhodesianum]MBI1691559.1 hypothetical protein [Methylorubrum sp. DB1722]MRI57395.1 hypothetical protein [Methylobacterium sp. DB1607]